MPYIVVIIHPHVEKDMFSNIYIYIYVYEQETCYTRAGTLCFHLPKRD